MSSGKMRFRAVQQSRRSLGALLIKYLLHYLPAIFLQPVLTLTWLSDMPSAKASRALSGPARYLVCSKVFSRANIWCPENVGRVCFRLVPPLEVASSGLPGLGQWRAWWSPNPGMIPAVINNQSVTVLINSGLYSWILRLKYNKHISTAETICSRSYAVSNWLYPTSIMSSWYYNFLFACAEKQFHHIAIASG